MKKILLLTLLLSASVLTQAQDTVKRIVHRWTMGPKTVVKDSTGKQYAMPEWTPMIRSGKYVFRPEDPNDANTAFIIYPKNENSHVIERRAVLNKTGDQATSVVHIPNPNTNASSVEPMKPYETQFFTTGQEIASMTVKDLDGNRFKLSELRGKVVVLNFWFIGCPACMQEIPELNKLEGEYHDNANVVFIGVALDSRSKLLEFLKSTPFNYHIVDDGRYYADKYNINLYPTSVIVDKDGKVQFHTAGFYNQQGYWMRKIINASLK